MTKAEFAKRLGYDRKNLDTYLNAKKKDINLVIKMAEVLEMSLYELIGMPEPGTDTIYGCLYINGRPNVVYNKEDLRNLLKNILP